MITIEWAKDPFYTDSEGTSISLLVKFEEFANAMRFGATPWDPEPWGVELYNNAIAGLYGPIGPMPPPAPLSDVSADQPQTTGTQSL